MQVTHAARTCAQRGAGEPDVRSARTVGTNRTGSFCEPSAATLAVV